MDVTYGILPGDVYFDNVTAKGSLSRTPPDSALPEVYRRLDPIYRTIRATTPPASSALCDARRKGA